MKDKGINVLSLFDGISCGRLALERAGIPVNRYCSSEINSKAIQVADNNWPQDSENRFGDVNDWQGWDIDFSEIDLVLAGSPCQSISHLGDRSGMQGKSGVFFVFLDILHEVQSKSPSVKFLLENVRGSKEAVDAITDSLGVAPEFINSRWFCAQNRPRLYWTNIDFDTHNYPDNQDTLQDILEDGFPEKSKLTPGRERWLKSESGQRCFANQYIALDPVKAKCLTKRSDASWNSNYVTRQGEITRLIPVEYERLQTLPEGYTEGVAMSHRYSLIGDGWTVDVVAHILRGLDKELP